MEYALEALATRKDAGGRIALERGARISAKFGGMDTSMMSKMRELGEENRRLRRMFRVSQSCYRYESKTNAENEQIAQLLMCLIAPPPCPFCRPDLRKPRI